MNIIKTSIEGPLILEPRIFRDDRGYFFESFSQRTFNEEVREIHFVQDNESKSSYGVVRGLHFQKPPFTQSKLVRVIQGAVLDVAVDIRRGSPTFGPHGRKSPSILRSTRICPRFQRTDRRGGLPV